MKNNMNVVLRNHHPSQLDSVIQLINDFIESLKSTKDSIISIKDDLVFCWKLRKSRKTFKSFVDQTLVSFKNYSEKNKVAIELEFYRAKKKLTDLIPEARKGIQASLAGIFSRFLLRELNKTLEIISYAQKEMSMCLYEDNTAKILSDPQLYDQLAKAWDGIDIDDDY